MKTNKPFFSPGLRVTHVPGLNRTFNITARAADFTESQRRKVRLGALLDDAQNSRALCHAACHE